MRSGVRRFLTGIWVAGPALAAHDGSVTARTAPELSDIALFVVAAAGLWFVRRALRRRLPRR